MHKSPTLPTRQWGVVDAAAGVVVAVVLFALVPTLRLPEPWSTLAGYLAVWVPLLGSVLVASYARGAKSLVRDFGLQFSPMDILVGLFVGLALRTVVFVFELLTYGHIATGPPTLGPVVRDGWWLLGAVVAPILIAPFIEELFFRGLLQRSLVVATPLAVVISSTAFALLHFAVGFSLMAALSTFIVGLIFGTLAARTSRLGAAIIGHVAFNGSLIVVMY